MNDELDKVYKWQSIFGRNGHLVSDKPIIIPQELAEHRNSFLLEEMNEYLEGNKDGDLVEVLDALCDIEYFLLGMVVIHGLQDVFTEAFDIVHQSNMSKLGEDGEPIVRPEDGKILKGPGYWKPKEKLLKLLQRDKILRELGCKD
jgi:predicted HAD superfamily Cof-like phosphohydrolase